MTGAFNELRPIIGVSPACAALAINRAQIYRDRDRLTRVYEISVPKSRRPRPPLALSEAERTTLLLILDSERFCDLAPAAVFATLLDEGAYHGSIRTMYRLLAQEYQAGERRKQRIHAMYAKPELLAIRPREVWCGTSQS